MKKRLVSVVTLFALIFNLPSAGAITFGEEVVSASTEYPGVVSVWYTTSPNQTPNFICTGSLIDLDIVLTAAHCVKEVGVYYIKYGVDIKKDGFLREVSGTWKSPNYSASQLVGDVGLLKLTDPIPGAIYYPLLTSSQIKSILLDKKKTYEIVGWGLDQNSISPQYLKKLFVDDYSTVMQKKYKSAWRSSIWIAVGKYDKTQKIYAGACNGDSGGPLFAYSKGQRYLVGVTSFGAEDCEEFYPSIYTRLSAYADEIKGKGLPFVRLNEITLNRAFPTVVEPPSISGTPQKDSVITCNKGVWSANTTSITLSWSGGQIYTPITAPSLILGQAYSPITYTCTVVGKNSNGEVSRTVSIVQPVTPVKPSTPYPYISGVSSFSNTTVGTVARCSASTYASDVTLTYQWGYGTSWSVSELTNPIGSGSTLTFTQSILDAVKGKYLICMATATNSAGSSSGFTTQSVTGASTTPTPTPSPTSTPTPNPTPSATTPSATPTSNPNPTVLGVSITGLPTGQPINSSTIFTCNVNLSNNNFSFITYTWRNSNIPQPVSYSSPHREYIFVESDQSTSLSHNFAVYSEINLPLLQGLYLECFVKIYRAGEGQIAAGSAKIKIP